MDGAGKGLPGTGSTREESRRGRGGSVPRLWRGLTAWSGVARDTGLVSLEVVGTEGVAGSLAPLPKVAD